MKTLILATLLALTALTGVAQAGNALETIVHGQRHIEPQAPPPPVGNPTGGHGGGFSGASGTGTNGGGGHGPTMQRCTATACGPITPIERRRIKTSLTTPCLNSLVTGKCIR